MGRSDPSGVGSIAIAIMVVLSVSASVIAGGAVADSTAQTELIVESQDRVDDDGNLGSDEDSDGDNVYASIQAAVDAAPDGAFINVTRGTYNESVVVENSNLVIEGDAGDSSAGAAGNAPVLDSDDTKTTAIKLTSGADNVVISGLQIRNYQTFGVFPEVGQTETIENITLRDNTISGLYIAVGVLSQEDRAVFKDVEVRRNVFSNVAFGVNMKGSAGVSDITDVTISDNKISEVSRDGVQLWAGTGLAEIRDVSVTDNAISDVKRKGIELVISGDENGTIKSIDVRRNTVDNATRGIDMRNPTDGTLKSVDVSHNDLLNNKIGTRYSDDDATNDVVVRYNAYQGNSEYAIESNSVDFLQAKNNWYGATSGPAISSNPDGTGDAVSENVTYDPFLTRVVDVENASAPVNETATVDITADAADVAGYQITVEFNESALEFEDIKGADFSEPTVFVEDGKLTFTDTTSEGPASTDLRSRGSSST